MNRDHPPSDFAVELAFNELMILGHEAASRIRATPLPDAVTKIRTTVSGIWPQVTPEAARDVMITAAEVACKRGWAEVPADVAERFAGQLDGANGLLELTADWINAGKPDSPGGFTPPRAFASSVAFDRAEDEQTLTSLSVLLVLAHGPEASK